MPNSATRPSASAWIPQPYCLPRGEARKHACPLLKKASRAAARSASGIPLRSACTAKSTSSEVKR